MVLALVVAAAVGAVVAVVVARQQRAQAGRWSRR
jgi:hypothetical protein